MFSKYGPNQNKLPKITSKWVSYCYSTLIGWYHLADSWGCVYGEKQGVDKDEITGGEAENKLEVVQGKIIAKDDLSKNINNNSRNSKEEIKVITPPVGDNSDDEKIEENIRKLEKQYSSTNANKNKHKFKIERAFLESALNLESQSTTENKFLLTASFRDHSRFVNKINSMNYMWKAENYDQFSTMTLSELNRYAGKKRFSSQSNTRNNKNGSLSHLHSGFKIRKKNTILFNLKDKFQFSKDSKNNSNDIPKNFSWAKLMTKPRSQVRNN